ncbi:MULTISPECIES: hypothetical protein [Actinomadura]|uniref:Uncharacterized protein n=1 Tax=Actinomadura yumaensis TaxID=111807 RepID=A0ABW2CWV2_9ACTN|nr:hypothetical protein [Actinomadura sp. J1-007]
MREVMDLLLIRFGIIVAGITVLIVAGFAVAIALKRRGRPVDARRVASAVQPVVRAWAERPPRGGGGRRGGLGGLAVRGALRYLDDRSRDRRPEDRGERGERGGRR